MVKRKKRLKKDEPVISMGTGKSRVEYDGEGFAELYNKWKSKAKSITASQMGVSRFTGKLYDMLMRHGIDGRIMGNSGPKETPGLAKELEFLDRLAQQPKFTPEEAKELKRVIGILNAHGGTDSDLNPRNIKFEGIVGIKSRTKKPVKKTIYGHYRTDDYVEYRTDYKNKVENIKAVDDDWWDTSKGVATPPMWQAIYGDGNLQPFNAPGLVMVITEGVKAINNAVHHVEEDAPVKIERAGAAKFAYEGISEIRQMMKIMVKDDEFTTKNGNFATTRARTRLMGTPINVRNNTESEKVKTLLNAKGTPGFVEDFYIYISRRQVNHMAKLAGWKPPVKEEPKEDEKLTSDDREIKDWKTIMKVVA